MTPGRRALGIAESYRGDGTAATSTLAGAVVAADRSVDDFAFGRCTVGGDDATDAIGTLWNQLGRPDVRYLFVAGVALAWYNVLDLERIHRTVGRPVIAVTFEESGGLESGIAAAFEGERRTERLAAYRSLPDRRRIETAGGPLFVRSVGLEAATADVVGAYTERRRPEPLRVAKRLARRIDAARRDGTIAPE